MVKKNKNSISINPTVSVLTITQYKRFDCLTVLIELIKKQTYKNIIEWVIVEGSKNSTDADLNQTQINEFIIEKKSELYFPIVYIERTKDAKLGELRNIGNNSCKGYITVCMDDDDYYFPDRVSHAVNKLVNSTSNIAGCSNHLMYDYNLNTLIQMIQFGPNHSINSCMAWKKEYLLTNSHDPTKEFGEESSFTKNFSEPMVSLEPLSTVILSSHSSNTFGKKKFFIGAINQIEPSVQKVFTQPIYEFIPSNILALYKNIFIKNNEPDYDITYMCGTFSIEWDPSDLKLGGSEQAVVNLSECWVKLGKSVVVYGSIPDKIVNGVVYKPWYEFNYNKKHKNLILWRLFGIITTMPFDIKADKILFDVHDNFSGQLQSSLIKYLNKANKIMLKSNYHKSCFNQLISSTHNPNNLAIIPNGIRVNKFSVCPENIQRNPYRFCYCSCYTRGLDKIIINIWAIIHSYEPRTELHVYYGMDGIRDEKYVNHLKNLLAQPGVMDHGRQPVEMIIREKYLSTFHFYITNTQAEIDCISIRESLVTGCIPLLSNFGVFKERQGIHFNSDTDKDLNMAAIHIIQLLKNPQKVEEYRKNFINDETIISWEQTAQNWLKYLVE